MKHGRALFPTFLTRVVLELPSETLLARKYADIGLRVSSRRTERYSLREDLRAMMARLQRGQASRPGQSRRHGRATRSSGSVTLFQRRWGRLKAARRRAIDGAAKPATAVTIGSGREQ